MEVEFIAEGFSMKKMAQSLGYRILFVDDELDLLEILCMQFSVAGCETQKASNGMQAMEMLQKASDMNQDFDVIVSDLNMPGMSGLELLKNLRQRGLPTPFVLFTGYGDKEKTTEALRLGANDFLEKPCDPAFLYEAVIRAAEKGRAFVALDRQIKEICREFNVPLERFESFQVAHQLLIKAGVSTKK